jgi:two-component system NtrC family sensor kinase
VARTKLATRMTIHVALVLVVALGVSGFLIIQAQRRTLTEEARLGAMWAADAFHAAFRDVEAPHDWPDVERTARRSSAQPRVDRVRLIGPTGQTVVASDGLGVGDLVPIEDASCTGCHEVGSAPRARLSSESRARIEPGRHAIRAFSAVHNDSGCGGTGCHDSGRKVLGIVEVVAPLRPINALISDSVDRTLLIAAVATVLAALIGGLVLGRWLQKPVKELVEGTRRVAEGDLDHTIECDRSDELGVLCEAFNRMTARLKETRLLLLRSEKLSSLGKLAAGVAHEINNPLTGILSFAEDLQEEIPKDSPLQDDCRVIVREALRCREIVRRLLDFSRPEAPSFERVALNGVTRQALKLVSKHARWQNVFLEVLLEPELPPVSGDAGQLQQIVINLLVNARDAVGKHGRVTVKSHSHSDGDRVELVVDDSGPGVPVELRDKIFEPFFSTKADRGTGIGLGVSRSIAETHGGHLLIADSPYGGARFRLILPTERATAANEKGMP